MCTMQMLRSESRLPWLGEPLAQHIQTQQAVCTACGMQHVTLSTLHESACLSQVAGSRLRALGGQLAEAHIAVHTPPGKLQ